jgi:glutamine amidotransferase PdxT
MIENTKRQKEAERTKNITNLKSKKNRGEFQTQKDKFETEIEVRATNGQN